MMPQLVRTRAELAAALEGLPGPRVLVPTMGALHAGHAALLDAAGPGAVVSVFVNPLQFGPGEDLDTYPHDLDADLALAAGHGAAVVFAPTVDVVYPDGPPQTTVAPGLRGEMLEGAARPGHFAGVLTVVAKLFGLVRPAVAVFGEKDFQQLVMVTDMVRDLELGVTIRPVPVVRDTDGLALSTRNRYLDPAQRGIALALPRALATGSRDDALALLKATPGLELDYCELVDPQTLQPVAGPPGRLLVAAWVGGTRLIDNVAVGDGGTGE
jgi:pantoate--beta-alanine ligase